MRLKSPIIFTGLAVKTQKTCRARAVRLVLETRSNWSARVDGVAQLAVDLPLDLARHASRLLRRSATRVEQRLAAAAAKRPLTTATKMARRSPRSKTPAIARNEVPLRDATPAEKRALAIAKKAELKAAAIAGKRPARKRSTLKKSTGVAAEIRAGRKL